ncbi:MAG TPA: hypothetical protein VFA74_14890 [Terriglobales bacterium]|nr:hypothetical protein [Terriglobales bacterium]
MSTLLVVFVMSFTAVSVISLGIMLAYGAVIGLLHAFGQSHQLTTPKLVLVTSQNHASGD